MIPEQMPEDHSTTEAIEKEKPRSVSGTVPKRPGTPIAGAASTIGFLFLTAELTGKSKRKSKKKEKIKTKKKVKHAKRKKR